VDALFRRAGERNSNCAFASCSYSEVRAGIFEFPALLKYRFVKYAFVNAGLSYQWVRHGSGTLLSWRTGPLVPGEVVDLTVHSSPLATPAENHVGFVGGIGIEVRGGGLRLSPEFRYTRWNSPYWKSTGPRGFFTASNLNQIEGLVAVRF
jgi:hypothetical protein